jgi:hypothetical protein
VTQNEGPQARLRKPLAKVAGCGSAANMRGVSRSPLTFWITEVRRRPGRFRVVPGADSAGVVGIRCCREVGGLRAGRDAQAQPTSSLERHWSIRERAGRWRL